MPDTILALNGTVHARCSDTDEWEAQDFTELDTGLFALGVERRSALILDSAGCPLEMNKIICPRIEGWGTLLNILASAIQGRDWFA